MQQNRWVQIVGALFGAAGFIARFIDRHPWLAYVGLGIILIVALRMIWDGGLEVMHATQVGM